MSDVKSINNHHPKSLLVELLRLLCRPLDGPDDSNGYLDVHLVCRDGVVGWNRFLLVANSDFLREALIEFDEENHATLLLPDISVATVSSMLKCTLNPAVRYDTLSVNEQQVMKLLGFPVTLSATSTESKTDFDGNQRKTPVSDHHLSSCMQDGYVSTDLNLGIEATGGIQGERCLLENENISEEEEDNLDSISLLSSTLSIGDVSRAIGLKNPDTLSQKKESIFEGHGKEMIEDNTLTISKPQNPLIKQPITEDNSSLNINLQDKHIENSVKTSLDKYFDRESVINTPTLPNLPGDEPDEIDHNLPDLQLHPEESILMKKPCEDPQQEKVVQSFNVQPAELISTSISNKHVINDDNIELESSSSPCQFEKGGWTICEESTSCDIKTSHAETSKNSEKRLITSPKSSQTEALTCPSPNCKLRFQRRLHYDRHVGGCLAKSATSADNKVTRGEFECKECGKSFHHPDNLRLHEKYHADLLIEKECNICGSKGIMGRHALTAHMEKFHSTKMPCPICNKLLSSRRLLNRHISRMHQKKLDVSKEVIYAQPKNDLKYCYICKEGFSTQQSLAEHKEIHNVKQKEDYHKDQSINVVGVFAEGNNGDYVRCKECSKLFRNQQHLVSHTNRSHGKQRNECTKCGRWCKNLSQHENIYHNAENILAQAMDESIDVSEGPSFVTKDLLRQSKGKQIKCDHCHKIFCSKYKLDAHVKRIHGIQNIDLGGYNVIQVTGFEGCKCDTCGKRYLNKSRLKRHLKEAHGENRFECTECGQFFPVKHSLERHVANVHHPTRHTCPICKDISVVHLKAHLTGFSHQMSSVEAQNLVDEAVGKFAARTHLPLDDVIRRREIKDMTE